MTPDPLRDGSLKPPPAPQILADPRIDRTGECWLWRGSRTAGGYGQYARQYVHRLAWSETFGPIPPGMHVCHHCDEPACVRPDHLFIGTARDNLRDALAKGRLNTSNLQRRGEWTHCPRGHEFTPDNTYVYPNGRRECRSCRRLRWLRRHA